MHLLSDLLVALILFRYVLLRSAFFYFGFVSYLRRFAFIPLRLLRTFRSVPLRFGAAAGWSRLDYQPLFGKGAHALSPNSRRESRPDTRERRKSSLRVEAMRCVVLCCVVVLRCVGLRWGVLKLELWSYLTGVPPSLFEETVPSYLEII